MENKNLFKDNWILLLAGVVGLFLLLISLLFNPTTDDVMVSEPEQSSVYMNDSVSEVGGNTSNKLFTNNLEMEESVSESIDESVNDQVVNSDNNIIKTNRKIIKTGNITLETLYFDESLELLKTKITSVGGYFESVNISGTSYNKESLKRGTITARVPANEFESMFNNLTDIGIVSNQRSNSQDISDRYFDTESRLKSLKTKEERLLVILNKTEDLQHIIQLERELSDTRYQIENLTGTLRKYDSLTTYSTITFTLVEVEKVEPKEPTKKETFIDRLKYSFNSSLNSMKTNLEEIVLYLASNSVQILLWISLLVIVILIIKKKLKRDETDE